MEVISILSLLLVFVDVVVVAEDPACRNDLKGINYRGTLSTTRTGRTCQNWNAESPHKPSVSADKYPDGGLGDHNYCRNPTGTFYTAWCYTTDPRKRYEYCALGRLDPACEEVRFPLSGYSIDLRLVNEESTEATPSEGRLAANLGGGWGTVCNDGFDTREADVVCRQLGFPDGATKKKTGVDYGVGSGDILLSDLRCHGREAQISDCMVGVPIGEETFCTHKEDVSIACKKPEPMEPLGIEGKLIPDSSFTASSVWKVQHGPERARLNLLKDDNGLSGWMAKTADTEQWLQVDLLKPYYITAVATQGSQGDLVWVSRYKIACSLDGVTFDIVQDDTKSPTADKIFRGNDDDKTVVKNRLPVPQVCRFVRLLPVTWKYRIGLRMELYGEAAGKRTEDLNLDARLKEKQLGAANEVGEKKDLGSLLELLELLDTEQTA